MESPELEVFPPGDQAYWWGECSQACGGSFEESPHSFIDSSTNLGTQYVQWTLNGALGTLPDDSRRHATANSAPDSLAEWAVGTASEDGVLTFDIYGAEAFSG